MPRFFFHAQAESRMTDDTGLELDDLVQARREAIRTCGEMIRDAPEGFWGSRPWNFTVTDSAGLVLCEVIVDATMSGA